MIPDKPFARVIGDYVGSYVEPSFDYDAGWYEKSDAGWHEKSDVSHLKIDYDPRVSNTVRTEAPYISRASSVLYSCVR